MIIININDNVVVEDIMSSTSTTSIDESLSEIRLALAIVQNKLSQEQVLALRLRQELDALDDERERY
jgi:hypothetical protein